MNISTILSFVAGGAVGAISVVTYNTMTVDNSTHTANATTNNNQTVISQPANDVATCKQVIADHPDLCPKAELSFEIPTEEEATAAVRQKLATGGIGKTASVKLGKCTEGGLVGQVTCGAELKISEAGPPSPKTIAFSKGPSGWIVSDW